MPQRIRRPIEAVDLDAVQRLYSPPPECFESAWLDDPEAIERKQRMLDKLGGFVHRPLV